MMIKPGISELSKCVDSRYTLVTMAAKRARMIGEERMHDMDAYGDEKPVSVAAEEIVEGKVGYVRSEAIKRAKAWEDEKAAAILSLNSNDDVQPEEGVALVEPLVELLHELIPHREHALERSDRPDARVVPFRQSDDLRSLNDLHRRIVTPL